MAITTGTIRMQAGASITTGWAVGDRVVGLVEFETDANADAATTQLEAHVLGYGTNISAASLADTAGYDGTEVAWTTLPRSGVLRTPPMVITTGTTGLDLRVRLWNGNGGTFRIGRVAILKS